ncbi:PBP1A family penicillin-binding protein [Paenibacillus sp. NEAU-GSW1]|nr:penicillin-binding protein 1A [Paenibacillus sp. NEAU-GSW1]MUT67312.1 PBP1A family penicillin-binding protein [Paenibacillus sp. NEAU-GSW1]
MTPRKWFFGLFFTAVIAIVCGIIGYLLIILNGERILTEKADMLVLGEASIIYDVNGNEVSKLYNANENRENVEYDEIPKLMLDAIVATEDQRFYEHSGIDFFAIGRAVVKDVIARSAVEGGSTITQQLAKNMFLTADKTLFRKATEASIAVALENKKTKQEILTMYLNRIYFGKRVYGIKNAAEFYFDKEPKDLELWEIATLAGMPKGPNRYNPIDNLEQSESRRAVVLKLMFDQGYITKEQMDTANAAVYKEPKNLEEKQSDPYKAYIDYVIEEAVKVMPGMTEEELRIGGYRIYTTLNTKAQTAVEEEFENDANFEESVDEQKVQGAMIIMDHRDGSIQAMAGGRDYVRKGLNRVEVERQPGSAFKPITAYGPALETGDYVPSTVLANDKKCFGDYCPKDSKGATPITMQEAIKQSRNLPAVWMLNQVGIKSGMSFAKKLGFELDSTNDRNLSIALGGLTTGVTPMQMAEAYSVFANDGKSVDPHSITSILNSSNKKVYTYRAPEVKQLMKEETAWYMTQMLQTVLEKGGTGTGARIDRPVAGKTGTTQHGIPGLTSSANRDAWFVGYTPEWTAAVWMGYDKTDKNHVLQKSSAQSAKMFAKVMTKAMKGMPVTSFGKPSSIPEEKKAPAAVTNFNAVFLEDQLKVQLSWEPLAESTGITYQVYRKEASETKFSVFVDSLTPLVEDMSVFPGMTYEYYVVAYDAENDLSSEPSDTITVAIPETDISIPEVPMEPEPNDPNGDGSGLPGDIDEGTATPPPGETAEPGDGATVPPVDGGATATPGTDDGGEPAGGTPAADDNGGGVSTSPPDTAVNGEAAGSGNNKPNGNGKGNGN